MADALAGNKPARQSIGTELPFRLMECNAE
jgi:hypothetical protein